MQIVSLPSMQNIHIEEIKARLREAVERDEPRQAQRLATLWVEADGLRARVEAELNPPLATPALVQRATPADESRKSIQIEDQWGSHPPELFIGHQSPQKELDEEAWPDHDQNSEYRRGVRDSDCQTGESPAGEG